MLTERFDAALLRAHDLHREQKRKGSDLPYISHLLAVTALVLEVGGTEDEAIAALLHDAIEDQQHPRAEIAREFGEVVAAIVEGCTDSLDGRGSRDAEDWRERKERYLASIPHESPSVILVSCADKLHNARSISGALRECGAVVWTRFNAGREDQLWYYNALADAFSRRREDTRGLADELDRAVQDIQRWVDEGKVKR